jgi:hypothetical protein
MDTEINKISQFSLRIASLIREKQMSCMEAILHICKEENVEPEDIVSYIPDSVKSMIQSEAEKNKLLKKETIEKNKLF